MRKYTAAGHILCPAAVYFSSFSSPVMVYYPCTIDKAPLFCRKVYV